MAQMSNGQQNTIATRRKGSDTTQWFSTGVLTTFFLWSVSGLATAASQCWDQIRGRPNVGSNEDGIEGKESTRKAERGWI